MPEITNKAIAKLLNTAASLLEVKGESSFKSAAYSKAARAVETLGESVAEVSRKGLLSTVSGIGSSTKGAIQEILKTGTFPELELLREEIPVGVQKILAIKGLGPKKVQHIWLVMGISSVGELYHACQENRLAREKGFGEKSQASVLAALEYMEKNQGKYHFAKLQIVAEELLATLQKAAKASDKILLTGEIRRQSEIQTQIEILADMQYREVLFEFILSQIETYCVTLQTDDTLVFSLGVGGATVILRFARQFWSELYLSTGPAAHIAQVGLNSDFVPSSEQEIYEKSGWAWVAPELREGNKTADWYKQDGAEKLIEAQDIKGVIHAHSTWSDGANSLREMAIACRELGYTYLVISDHSQSAFYANGLSEGRVEAQHQEIDKLNKELAPFRIFKGIESDILNDGNLDYGADFLAKFEIIIASVHSNLRMDESKAMQRLLRAIENPHTRILGHPTGRLLLSREGYPVDHRKMIDACAANGVVIELNANPLRLDMDYRWIEYAMHKNVQIAINPDAHSIAGISDIRWGVSSARRGFLTKEMCLNTLDLQAFEAWVKGK